MWLKQAIVAMLTAFSMLATAQDYPTKPVRLIVPFAPGGPNDVLGRIVAQKLSEQIGQQVVVDNRSGGGGSTGTVMVANSAPDGYTLLFSGTSSLVINPNLYKVTYDPIKDFSPVSLVGTAPSLLAIHPSIPAKTLKDLIGIAKTSPGRLNYASGGVGGTPHLAGELLKTIAGIEMVHVPFRGGGPALVALTSGEVDMYIGGLASMLTLVNDRRIRPIAVTSTKRTLMMPQMPTFIESGVPGYDISNWYAVFAPANTPNPVIAKLNKDLAKATASPDFVKRFSELGTDVMSSTPEQLAAYHRQDFMKWSKVIKTAGIKVN